MLVGALLCTLAHETAGAARAPAFPAPSELERAKRNVKLRANHAARTRRCVLCSPSPGGGGSTRSGGWGDPSKRGLFGWRDFHPTPSRISLRSCEPTLPLQGRVSKGR